MSTFTASDGKVFDNRNEYRKYEFQLSYTFTNKEGVHDLVKLPGSVDGQPFDIGNLKNCTAVVMDATDQVQIDEVENSKIFLGATGESVFVRNCKDCTFYLACKQLRTRECTNCTFYLYCISEPIIEMSSGIKFGCFNGGYPEQKAHMQKAGLNPEVNKWSMVFDFNDESKTGKNFTIMPLSSYEKESWFPNGSIECERAVPLLEGNVAAAQAYKLVPENTTGGGQSFSFNTTQEQAEAAVAQAEQQTTASVVPPPPTPKAVVPPPAAAPTPAQAATTNTISVGSKVEARYAGGTTWYFAHVVAISEDGKFDLDYLDGSKEKKVSPEFVQLPIKRTVGWNPAAAKAKAEERKAKGGEAPSALGSDVTAGLKLRYLIEEEDRHLFAKQVLEKEKPMNSLNLVYFHARGVIEPTRMMLSMSNVPYNDVRLATGEDTPDLPKFADKKASGEFAMNLDKVPVLQVGDSVIGQSKAIDRFIAKKFGYLGESELEAAVIDMYTEHCNDVKKAYNDTKKGKSGEELDSAKKEFISTDLVSWAMKIEKCMATQPHIEKLNYADIRLYELFFEFFDDLEGSKRCLLSCPKLKACCERVSQSAKAYLDARPVTKF